jgi:hypothetical protein
MESLWPPTGQWPPGWQWPTDFRKFMFWIFGLTSLGFVANTLYTIPQPHTLPLLANMLVGPIFSVHMAAISGVAALTIWYGKAWARGWAIAASLMYILMFLRQFIVHVRPTWDHHVVPLLVGVLGLVSFGWRDKPVNPSRSGCADS